VSPISNALFTAYKATMLGNGTAVDLDADTIKAMFVDHADDTPVAATDDFIDDIASAARVPAIGSCPTLGTKTTTSGTFDAADSTFTSLSGDQVESLILFKDSGVEGTSNLLVLFDTFASGMPLTPNGGNVTVTYNASGIFSL
jgi:hypothetical protein